MKSFESRINKVDAFKNSSFYMDSAPFAASPQEDLPFMSIFLVPLL